MSIHIVKLCVGTDTVEHLARWVCRKSSENNKAGRSRVYEHITRMRPRRQKELVDGGSLYWVIKGMILARQKILAFEPRTGADGVTRCAIMMDPKLVLTEPQQRRAFQGWRYLRRQDAPKDLIGAANCAAPPELRMELAALGLL